jgi:hypothetical protein
MRHLLQRFFEGDEEGREGGLRERRRGEAGGSRSRGPCRRRSPSRGAPSAPARPRAVELDPPHEARAAHVDDGRAAPLQRGELPAEPRAESTRPFATSPPSRARRGPRGRAGRRPGCRRTSSRGGPASRPFHSRPVRTAPSGSPPPSGLASVTMSGTTPACWKAKRCPGAPEAALDLVEDEDGAGRVASVAGRAEELGRERDDSPFALDRLEEDRRGRLVDGGLQRLDVVRRGRTSRPGTSGANGSR